MVCDQTCGTGGMLSAGYNYIKPYNLSVDVFLFGQAIDLESYAMCLAEMHVNASDGCYQAS